MTQSTLAQSRAIDKPVVQGTRPGGRAARIQAAVQDAVDALKQELPSSSITVPMIACRAGVTPSTIYRRWGDVSELLAESAVRQLQADVLPPDSGHWQDDLALWLEQFVEEMGSNPGRELLREVMAPSSAGRAGQCHDCIEQTLQTILARGEQQGARPPELQLLIDHVVAPVLYRIIFSPVSPSPAYAAQLLQQVLAQTPA